MNHGKRVVAPMRGMKQCNVMAGWLLEMTALCKIGCLVYNFKVTYQMKN